MSFDESRSHLWLTFALYAQDGSERIKPSDPSAFSLITTCPGLTAPP